MSVITWDDLKRLESLKPAELEKQWQAIIHRDEETQKQYEDHKIKIKEDGLSPVDYLAKKEIGYDDRSEIKNMVSINKFKYSLEECISQKILWIGDPETEKDFLREVTEGLKNGNVDYVILPSQPKTGSIKDLKHYHLFIKVD